MRDIFTIGGGTIIGVCLGNLVLGQPINGAVALSGAIMSLIGLRLHLEASR